MNGDSRLGRVVIILLAIFLLVAVGFAISSRSNNYDMKHPILDEVRQNFSKLNPKYALIPLRSGDSAYTENKEVITLCLVDPDSGKFYDMNTIMYVALHELAHVLTPEGKEEHGDAFKQNFSDLLRQGSQIGFYNPRKSIPSTYCKVPTRK